MALLSDRTELTAPADGDLYVTTDVSDTTDAATGTDKKITWSNIKAGLKTYFDTLYAGVLGADDNYVTDAEKVKLTNLSGTNSGDQTTIVGITGTKAQFDTACSDGNFLYVGDAPTISSGAGAPASTPSKVGDIYIDTTADDAYIAVGTASSSDWEKSNDGAGGGISDGDKGDITVSASGATWTIDAGTVTLAKQADMATASVVYRKTAGSGAPEVQTLATLKTDLGLTGTNSGDQTSIVGITGTMAQFDTAVSDGNIVYQSQALGTPASGTLTNCGSLPVSGITASTVTAIGVGSVELGHASDTTISRVSAGVAAIEGVNILTTATGLPLSGGTMTGNITLGENTSIDLDPAGSADGKYSGICITGTAGATLAFGDLIYLAVADSRWELCDADATATAGTPLIGMCVLAAAADGNATKILLQGTIRADAKFPALTIGAPAYVGETAGAIQTAIPTGADNVIRVVGRALTADELYFCPSQDHQITVA